MHRIRREKTMPSNNSKYSQEMREQTATYILESGKSATRIAEELGIDTNSVCRWVRDYRRKHKLPSYAEEKGLKPKPPKDNAELTLRIRELEKQLKDKDKEIKLQKKKVEDERVKVEILKKSLHIFMQP
jgi:transposase-like protein